MPAGFIKPLHHFDSSDFPNQYNEPCLNGIAGDTNLKGGPFNGDRSTLAQNTEAVFQVEFDSPPSPPIENKEALLQAGRSSLSDNF